MGERGHSTPRHPSGDPHERATDPPATKGNSYSSADLHVLPTPVRVFEKNSSALSFAARMPEPRRSGKNPRPLSPCHVCCRGVGRYCPRSGNRLTSSPRTLPALSTPISGVPSLRVQETGYRLQRSQLWQPILGKVGGRVAQRPAAADRQAPAQASTGCGLEPDPEPRARFMFWLLAQGTVGRWLLLEVRGQTRLV